MKLDPERVKLNPNKNGPFWGCSRMGEGTINLPPRPLFVKIYHIYTIIMKLGTYLTKKNIEKIYKSRATSLEFC